MNVRSRLEATIAALVILVGLLIGGMFGLLTRPSSERTQPANLAGPTRRPVASRHVSPPATPAPAPVVNAAVVASRTSAPTDAPTPTPSPVAATAAAVVPPSGIWRIEESNVYVGTIVWSGAASVSNGGPIVLDVHKERVAGHAVSPCERGTTLHVTIARASAQSAPYQEVNCSGAATGGEMRVTSFSADGRSFSGSFWSGGTKLGDFTALHT